MSSAPASSSSLSSACNALCSCSGFVESVAVPNYCNCGHPRSSHNGASGQSSSSANNLVIPSLLKDGDFASPGHSRSNSGEREREREKDGHPSATPPKSISPTPTTSTTTTSSSDPPPPIPANPRRMSRIAELVSSYQQKDAAATPALPPRPTRPPKPVALVEAMKQTPSSTIISPTAKSPVNSPQLGASSSPSVPSLQTLPSAASSAFSSLPTSPIPFGKSSLPPTSFADKLYHKYDIVCTQADTGLKVAKRLKGFLSTFAKIQEKAAIETQKAANVELNKLLTLKSGDRMPTTMMAWKAVFEKINKLSYAHQTLFSDLNSMLIEPLNTFHTQAQPIVEKCEEEGKRINQQADSLKIAVNKERESIRATLSSLNEKKEQLQQRQQEKEAAMESGDVPRKNSAFSLFGKTTSDRQKEVEKMREKAYAACQHYESTISSANHQHQKNMHELPSILTQIQQLEENRLSAMNAAIIQFSRCMFNFHERILSLSMDLVQVANSMNSNEDMNGFIDGVIREYGAANASYTAPFHYDINTKPDDLKADNYGYGTEKSGLFYCTLDEVMAFESKEREKENNAFSNAGALDVPLIVPTLIGGVESMGGFTTEGIFRLSASSDELNNLKKSIEKGDYSLKVCNGNPHIAACLLKLWLRDLSEPLIPYDLYQKCVDVGKSYTTSEGSTSSQSQLVEIKPIISKLPVINRRVIYHIIVLIQKLLLPLNMSKTRMTLNNLSIVFSPSFLRSSATSNDPMAMLQESKYSSQFVQMLVEVEGSLFAEEREWAKTAASGFELIKSGWKVENATSSSSSTSDHPNPPLPPSHPSSNVQVNSDPAAIDSAWQATIDTATGLTYYYNSITQESTWTKPASMA